MPKRFLEDVKGKEVVGLRGKIFGEVADLELTGTKISGFVIQVRKSHVVDLGLDKPFWSRVKVTIPARYVKAINEVVVLSISLKDFALQLAKTKAPGGKPAIKKIDAAVVAAKPGADLKNAEKSAVEKPPAPLQK